MTKMYLLLMPDSRKEPMRSHPLISLNSWEIEMGKRYDFVTQPSHFVQAESMSYNLHILCNLFTLAHRTTTCIRMCHIVTQFSFCLKKIREEDPQFLLFI